MKHKPKRSKVRVHSYEPATNFAFFVTIPRGEIADAVKDGPAGIEEMVSAYQHLLGAGVRAKVEEILKSRRSGLAEPDSQHHEQAQ